MINPYGDDDEDFDLSYLLNRHAKVINLGTNIITSESCPPMKDEHLKLATAIRSPKPDRLPLKRRVVQTLTEL